MILMLDAHALLWWWSDDPQLAEAVRRSIRDPANAVLVSAATTWEIAVKRAAGRLDAPADILGTLEAEHLDVVPITGADTVVAADLAMHHRDPFDRMLVAQAIRLDATIVTRDPTLSRYDVRVLPA